MEAAGEGKKRGFTVGFALTVLQRRLASSPEAILKSLERRHKRLEKRRSEMRYGSSAATDDDLARRLRDLLGKDPTEADLSDFGADVLHRRCPAELGERGRGTRGQRVADAATARPHVRYLSSTSRTGDPRRPHRARRGGFVTQRGC